MFTAEVGVRYTLKLDMIEIDGHTIGSGSPCFVVAEVGQAHDGSLGAAHAYIDAVAETGAQAIKFQTHIADAESTPGEPWRVKFSQQDATRYEYWKRMEFSPEQWKGLAEHAREVGLVFLSSPFSVEAVELLDSIGCPAWKIGAGEVSNLPLIERAAKTGKPVLLSSGMSDFEELDRAVSWVRGHHDSVAVYQCTSKYPCPPESWGLNVIADLRERYGCPVGLSDHSGTPFAGLAAVSLGAQLLEIHVVMSKRSFGPDVPASITIDALGDMVRGIRLIETALAHPVHKGQMADELSEMRTLFNKSVVANCDLEAGAVIDASMLAFKKPGTGIPAADWKSLLGRRLHRAVPHNSALAYDDFEDIS